MSIIRNALAIIALSATLVACVPAENQTMNATSPLLIKNTRYFNTTGSVASFSWAPERYQSDFRYDVFYYIPKNLERAANTKALIFMHGGGSSTMDRPGSIQVAKMYIDDLKQLADALQFVLVVPAANGLNWGGHTRGMINDLASIMRSDLNIDPDHFGLSGHSMGGMGITRSFYWLVNDFAFFMPLAAGLDFPQQTEHNLNKVFNVPYSHQQGLQDHFTTFIERCQAQEKNTKDLESKYGVPSKLRIEYYNGPHNYDLKLVATRMNELFKVPRDLHQKRLWGSLYLTDGNFFSVENNIRFHVKDNNRYMWFEATDYLKDTRYRVDFIASIEDNVITIDVANGLNALKGVRLYLTRSMVDADQPVVVKVNGNVVDSTDTWPTKTARKDDGFTYDGYTDFRL